MANTTKLYGIRRNREVIYLETIKELYQRINSGRNDPYNLVRKGAVLRLLLIDKLYAGIGSPYRFKFKVRLLGGNINSHSLSSEGENPTNTFTYYRWNHPAY